MSPPPIIAPPTEKETSTGQEQEISRTREPVTPASLFPAPTQQLFFGSLLDLSQTRPAKRTWELLLSLCIHAVFLGIVLLIPLFFTQAIDLKEFTRTFLVAPPPPPPPPPAAPVITKVASTRRVFTRLGRLVAPAVIPEKVAMLKEEPLPPDVGLGIVGGVPGGVPGGQAGGVIGGIISSSPRTFIPAAPVAPPPRPPVRVGGRVKAPRPISMPDPIYPALARQARLQGDVVIDAVIDTNGNVVEMQVISGPPLLIPAALDALKRWKYEPTYLNEEPIAVKLIVTIKFQLY